MISLYLMSLSKLTTHLPYQGAKSRLKWISGERWVLTCQAVAVDSAGPPPPDLGNFAGDRITDLGNSRGPSVEEKNNNTSSKPSLNSMKIDGIIFLPLA